MITYSLLGKKGNLGNQLFQLAATYGIAKEVEQEVAFPYWKYTHYFKSKIPAANKVPNLIRIAEPGYHFIPNYFAESFKHYPGKNFDIDGWLQSEKYWNKQDIRTLFDFKDDLKSRLLSKYSEAFTKPTIAISIRRGDFVDNPNYEQLPISYYVGALLKYFPNYEDYNIICFSDDVPYCRHHFESLSNVYYPVSELDISQLCLMSLCDNFIISNSTFSWWGAYLGEKQDSIVVRPSYNMAGDLLKTHNEKDYWPITWDKIFDHKKEKINLLDVTFTIPVFYDHEDRAQNLRLNIDYLRKHFDTKIILGEQGGNHFTKLNVDQYIKFEYTKFHRTKMLNEMAQASDNEILVNWDVDVIIPVMQLVRTVEAIRNGADMVYPYDGRFARVDRGRWYTKINHYLDTFVFMREKFTGARPGDGLSVGGAIFFKKDSFLSGGLENERFISYAPEDQERYYRFNKLGYNVQRIPGVLYHIDHYIGSNSYIQHPLYKQNEKEFHRIRGLSDLRKEIDTWPWYHEYSIKYYEEIIEDSTQSRDELFKLSEVTEGVSSIIDIGCGIGQWGKNIPYIYQGIDYKIPDRILAISKDDYREFNLESNDEFPFKKRYDLALCMEVLEHIDSKYAEKSVDLLTTLSDKVLFSAAVPGQGGRGHKNEQWQTYWASLFKQRGYYPTILPIRNNSNIAIWYRNNTILYTKKPSTTTVEDYIHPELYTNIVGTHTKWKGIKPYSSDHL